MLVLADYPAPFRITLSGAVFGLAAFIEVWSKKVLCERRLTGRGCLAVAESLIRRGRPLFLE